MISSPRGLPSLDVDGERERLETALRPHVDAGLVELHWLDDVSWSGVHDMLLEQEWHVLHFVGHGTYDADSDEGVLAFVGRDGRPDYVTASALADLLDEAEPTPRLVVLNSCQSGAAGTADLFSGTAAALAHSGIRAVAAMQFAISDVAAIAFARAFYTALTHGRGIDEAMRSGRIGILGLGRGTLEWVTPVLYLRGEDTRLFDMASVSSPRPAARVRTAGPSTPRLAASAAPRTPKRPSRRKLWLVGGAIAAGALGAAATVGVIAALNLLPTGGPNTGSSAVQLDVPAHVQWAETGVSCKTNDIVNIKASGQAQYDTESASRVGPEGLTGGELVELRVYPDANTASLIGTLDTFPQPFFVGYATAYTCPIDGNVLLGMNDNDLDDNSGEFRASLTVTRAE